MIEYEQRVLPLTSLLKLLLDTEQKLPRVSLLASLLLCILASFSPTFTVVFFFFCLPCVHDLFAHLVLLFAHLACPLHLLLWFPSSCLHSSTCSRH